MNNKTHTCPCSLENWDGGLKSFMARCTWLHLLETTCTTESSEIPTHPLLHMSKPKIQMCFSASTETCLKSFTHFLPTLYKKVTLLKYFRSYMTEHLLKTGGSAGEGGRCVCVC